MHIIKELAEEWGDREVYNVTPEEGKKIIKSGGKATKKEMGDKMIITEVTHLGKKYVFVEVKGG